MKISLLMVVCNEEQRLLAGATIASVRGVVDEVVIVVQESQDRTLELARAVADVVIEHPCHGYCEPSRKVGVEACTGDFILMLDADESLTEWGAARLRELAPQADVHELRRLTTIGGGTYEDACHPRLFLKGDMAFSDALHQRPRAVEGAQINTVDSQVVVTHAKTWAEQTAANQRYARLKGGAPNYKLQPPAFRADTSDQSIWESMTQGNEYRLPDDMAGQVIIDIGGHIGGFAHACLMRGAWLVVSVEPEPANFDLLEKNLACFGSRSIRLRYAAWRSDTEEPIRFTNLGSGHYNTGGNSCAPDGLGSVCGLSFDVAFQIAHAIGGKVDLVKLDCEGAEGPIVHTSKRLGEAGAIIGEWHAHLDEMFQAASPVAGVTYSPASLRAKLESWGFKVEWYPTPESTLGLFFARKA